MNWPVSMYVPSGCGGKGKKGEIHIFIGTLDVTVHILMCWGHLGVYGV